MTDHKSERRLLVSEDIAGQFAAQTIRDPHTGRVLVQAGVRITSTMVRRLRGYGVQWVECTSEPLVASGGSLGAALRVEAAQTVEQFAKQMLAGGDAQEGAAQVTRVAGRIVDEIIGLTEVVYNLRHLRSWDAYTFQHSVQVAELAVVIGKDIGLGDEELKRLAIGAVLHDIGKAAIPRTILQKRAGLSDDEYAVIKTHPRLGWEMVRRSADYWHTATIAILQHHERLDGSGYPDGRRGDAIYPFSRIVAVADAFDAMRADRGYRGPMAAHEVQRILRSEAGNTLDAAAVSALLRCVALYPTGEVVRLSDGRVAVVSDQNTSDYLHPRVELLTDGRGLPLGRESLDLAEAGLEITEIVEPERPTG